MRRLRLLAVLAVLAGGGILVDMASVRSAAAAELTITIAPPAPRYEVVPVAPPGYWVWDPGRWNWTGSTYAWVPGRYIPRDRHYANWAPGHWAERGHRWYWTPGHWR